MAQPLTFVRASEMLRYDAETGHLYWRRNTAKRRCAGMQAGRVCPRGYISLSVDGKPYKAHRIAWLLMTGEWPKHEIDHLNGVRNDNRAANLRDAPKTSNMQNMDIGRLKNRTGLIGVCPNKLRFVARITCNKERIYLGIFKTPEEAHAAYMSAKERYHDSPIGRFSTPPSAQGGGDGG